MIYLDNAATTSIYPELKEMIINRLDDYGNPSNLYSIGQYAHDIIEESRVIIADSIKCLPEEIFFTSGASEGNAWAVRQGEKCLCSAYEHHNIINNEKSIVVDEDYLERTLNISEPTFSFLKKTYANYVYSHMLVNNETGEIFNVRPLFHQAKKLNMFVHCDMTQALGNVMIDPHSYPIDMATFSGHKVHAPKGIGFVYINKESQNRIKPLIYGGGQERNLRAGTENVPYIECLSWAVKWAVENAIFKWEHCTTLREKFLSELKNGLESDLFMINSGADNIPSTLNITFKNIEGESLMLALEEKGIIVGTGSACSTGEMEPSYVLKEMGVPDEYINGAIRLSFDLETKEEDMILAAREIISCYKSLTGI